MTKFPVSILVLIGLALPSAAWAHDEIEATTPINGATVEAGVIPIRLEFGEAPMDLPFGQGNLIAVAKLEDGEQLGPACALIQGNTLSTNVQLAAAGDYKVLWRVASDDGHVVTGEFKFTVVNNSYYTTDHPGNQCFDSTGKELDIKKQELMSKKIEPMNMMLLGLIWGFVFVALGALAGAWMVKRRQKN